MSEQRITNEANRAVKELITILELSDDINPNAYEVQVEGEDLAIINLEGEDLYVEVHLKEFPSFGDRKVLKPVYIPGYYHHSYGGYNSPPEVEDKPLLECAQVIQAACQLVGEAFYWKALNATETFEEVETIFD